MPSPATSFSPPIAVLSVSQPANEPRPLAPPVSVPVQRPSGWNSDQLLDLLIPPTAPEPSPEPPDSYPDKGIAPDPGQNQEICDFRNTWRGFRLSNDGATVEYGKGPSAIFSVGDLALKPADDVSSLDEPIVGTPEVGVSNWRYTFQPTINCRKLALAPFERSCAVAVSPDSSMIVLGTELSISRFDSDAATVWRVPLLSPAWAVNLSRDHRLVAAALGDGTIRWFRASDGQELLTYYPHADRRRWVAWTESGYYACSPGAESLIFRPRSTSARTVSEGSARRSANALYRPDVIERVLATLDEHEALVQADAARGDNPAPVAATATATATATEIVVAPAVPEPEPAPSQPPPVAAVAPVAPVVTILSPLSGDTVVSRSVTIRYTVRSDSSDAVSEVRALIDGQPADAMSKRVTVVSTDGQRIETMIVGIPEHDCMVSLVAHTGNAVSEPATIRLLWGGEASSGIPDALKPKLYILAVGVSAYNDSSYALQFPAKDARDFVDTMARQQGQLYSHVKAKVLTDADATHDKILDGLEWIQDQTTSKDVAMVFFSGHGITDSQEVYYYLPSDFTVDHMRSTGLPDTEIRRTLQSIAGKVLFFVDTCESGNSLGRKGPAGGLARVIDDLASADNGVVVFAASTGRQAALENPDWGNGAFTKALVEGLGGKADLLGNGIVTISELNVYICERVKSLTDGRQTPVIMVPRTVSDFPVAVVP